MHLFCYYVLAVLVLTPADEILIGSAICAVARAARNFRKEGKR